MKLGIYGTKMRSVINLANHNGIGAIVKQQFEVAEQISHFGLMPILEPEVSIKSPEKSAAEAMLLEELLKGLDALPNGKQVMLKVTLPDITDQDAAAIVKYASSNFKPLPGGDDINGRLPTTLALRRPPGPWAVGTGGPYVMGDTRRS